MSHPARRNRPEGPAGPAPESDAAWQSVVTLVTAPHPGLTPAQARAIAADYNIRGGSTSLPVRRALLFYALKRLGLDVPQNARPPHEQHIVLLNRKDVEAVLVRRAEA